MKLNFLAFKGLALAALLFSAPSLLAAQTLEHPGRDNSAARVSPNASTSQTIGSVVVSVEYSRPSVKGRNVFGGLQKYGEVWRAGANEATTIVIPKDARIEGEDLAAGVYALFVVPGESEWKVLFNSQDEQWGHFDYDASMDVLAVTVTAREAEHEEMLSYSFEDVGASSATLVLHWSTTEIPVKIEFAD